ncbi:MAG TPA: hypothetical protein VK862_12935 [Afifellaceae bacterium]|nr:hypothetical protein [Afifellaceae bacterium]
MKLHTRRIETRFGLFNRRTEHELFCRIELKPGEREAYERSGLGEAVVIAYRPRGVPLDTRLASLVAGETRFGSEDPAELEAIERQVGEAAARLADAVGGDLEVQSG